MSTHEIRRTATSELTLLVTWIRADHPEHASPPDELAVLADPLHRCSHFHRTFLRRSGPSDDPSLAVVEWRDLQNDLVPRHHSGLSDPESHRGVRQNLPAILQLRAKEGVRQDLRDRG